MKKSRISLILLSMIPILMFGQNSYYVKDSLRKYGVTLIDENDVINSKLCQVRIDNEIFKYSPDEVSEYGFKDGRVYLSKEVKISDSVDRVFLERLYSGKTTLYYYCNNEKKTFFLEKDSSILIEIPKLDKKNINYKKQLSSLSSDCPDITNVSEFVAYNKRSFTKYITRYNSCELKPFPHLRFGFAIGYELNKLRKPSRNLIKYIDYFDFKYERELTLGLFIDHPLFVSDFSLHTEIFYSDIGYSYNKLVDNNDYDFVAEISSLKIPVLIRYTYPLNTIRPFIDAGIVMVINIKHENMLFETNISETLIKINDTEYSSLIADNQGGYSVGGGLEYNLSLRKSAFIELRYMEFFANSLFLGESAINLTTGIIF